MTNFIVNMVYTMFGGGIADKVSAWMNNVWQALMSIFNGSNIVEAGKTAFAGVAGSLVVLYFLMDLASHASRDILTLEKFTTMFIKCTIVMLVLINSTFFMNGILSLGKGIYDKARNTSMVSSPITITDSDGNPYEDYSLHSWESLDGDTDEEKKANIAKKIDDEYGGFISGLKKIFSFFVPGLIAWIVTMACQVICFLKCTTNALNICIRGFMAPLALPQFFEDGQRSAAVRYFKAFAAECLEMALIVVTLKLASEFSAALQPAIFSINGETSYLFTGGQIVPSALENAFSIKGILPTLLPHLAAAGGVMGVSKICHDIVG